jgi:hypothetical protein
MPRTALASQKATTAAAGPIVALRASSSRDVRVFEVGVFIGSAVSGTVGIGRPATAGTSSASVGPVAQGFAYDNQNLVGTTVLDTTWSAAPTAPAAPWRRAVLPGTIGAGVIWTFPSGIVIPTSGTIILWQFSTAVVTYECYFEFDE